MILELRVHARVRGDDYNRLRIRSFMHTDLNMHDELSGVGTNAANYDASTASHILV